MSKVVSAKQIFSDPVLFFAFGMGSGLSPWAPGTMGSLLAVAMYPLVFMQGWGHAVFLTFILLTTLVGIYLCGEASKRLGVHDHSGIVWDEFVGQWIALWLAPATWTGWLAAFVLFRLFDIWKPFPIGWLDKRVHGGFGIMIDDVVAGLFAAGILYILPVGFL